MGLDKPETGLGKPEMHRDKPEMGLDKPQMHRDKPEMGLDKPKTGAAGAVARSIPLHWPNREPNGSIRSRRTPVPRQTSAVRGARPDTKPSSCDGGRAEAPHGWHGAKRVQGHPRA